MTSGYVIPMSSPDLTDDDIAAVNQVLRTCYLGIDPQIETSGRGLSSYVGAACAVGISSRVAGLRQVIIR